MLETRTTPDVERSPVSDSHWNVATPAGLILLGLASAALYWWGRDLHRFIQWLAAYTWLFIGQLAIYVVACFLVMRSDARRTRTVKLFTIGAVLVFAAAFRIELAAERPFLSADVYRYVWDGRVQAAGVNPYRHTPGSEELRELRDDRVFANIAAEDRSWLSAYPPAAQIVFLAAYKLSPTVTGYKLAMSAFDLIAVGLIMLTLARFGLDPARAIETEAGKRQHDQPDCDQVERRHRELVSGDRWRELVRGQENNLRRGRVGREPTAVLGCDVRKDSVVSKLPQLLGAGSVSVGVHTGGLHAAIPHISVNIRRKEGSLGSELDPKRRRENQYRADCK